MKASTVIRVILCSLFLAGGSRAVADGGHDGLPPGVVIHNSPAVSHRYVGSPSIVILPDGTYIASHDYFGKKLPDTFVYRSSDRGSSWTRIARLKSLTWATLFSRGKELYLIGISPKSAMGYGDFVVRKSADNGHTWTEPLDEKSGLIRRGFYHCAPVPVVRHRGRYWRALENMGQEWGWGPFSALMTSIPCKANLLDAGQWLLSDELQYNAAWKAGATAWLEGNAVVTKKGEVKDLLRVAYGPDDVAAMISVSPDGKQLAFQPRTDFIHFPGGAKKFTIRYDKKSGKYWTLSNFVLSPDRYDADNGSIRNTQVLMYSGNLREWCIADTILTCPKPELYGFQYVDWQFDGKDIIFVSRTAWPDETGNPPRQHDANYLTFHRIRNFRQLPKN